MRSQPTLHELDVCLQAPTVTLSAPDGQIRPGGVQGVFHGDLRALSTARLLVAGEEPEPLAGYPAGPARSTFVATVRGLDGDFHAAQVRVTRRRTVLVDGVVEEIELWSTATERVGADVVLQVASDLAELQDVRRGDETVPVVPAAEGAALVWRRDGKRVRLTAAGAERDGTAFRWPVGLPPGGSAVLRWRLHVHDPARVVVPAGHGAWTEPAVRADDRRLPALVDRSLGDLRTLRLATSARPGDTFLAAGAPWYFTLFGRDSLWAARMLLPLGTDLAASTLRTLAGYQGTRHDPSTGEAPGKIMHELRAAAVALGDDAGTTLPPVYYGTVDATLLWILLLHDGWRWGLPADAVRPLLPHLQAAARWLLDWSDPDGDGFVEYVDESGRGLANQGWKDSADAVRFRDGRLAEGPIALCEVQGYAHEAALAAAALLDAFALPGAAELRGYATTLAAAFRERFWVTDERGTYPALALDGAKRRVDAHTSNAGHLLGTGLLDATEVDLVARRLVAPDLSSGYGLRTMSAADGGYAPLSYHCGSVWPHDTAIVATGLMREGRAAEASTLVAGLLDAAPAFGFRLPELYAGDGAADVGRPLPYPTSCRPQAWSAASAVAALQVLLGLRPDVPAGVLDVRPAAANPVGALRVDGLRVGGEQLSVEVTASGDLAEISGTGLRVTSHP